jgi:tetratricopeptide (TPR) repeat protein
MAALQLFYEWDWAEAERELRRALELSPNSADAHYAYGIFLKTMGRYEEQLLEDRIAQELDPLSLLINADVGEFFYYSRRYDEAVAQGKKILEISEGFFIAYHLIGRASEQNGMHAEAVAAYTRAIAVLGRDPMLLANLAHVLAVSGQHADARQLIDELMEISKDRFVPSFLFGLVYMGLDDRDRAFEWLEKAYEERFFLLIWINGEPRFDRLRGDPRFAELVQRVGLSPMTLSLGDE